MWKRIFSAATAMGLIESADENVVAYYIEFNLRLLTVRHFQLCRTI
jgi:hypothetical protein